jgi:hypothetical protein
VSLSSFSFVFSVNAELQELIQEINGFLEVTKLFMDVSDLLVALSLLILVFRSLRRIKALLEVPEGFIIIKVILELSGDDLVHSDQLSRDFFFNFLQVTITSFISGSFQIIFSVRIDVEIPSPIKALASPSTYLDSMLISRHFL